MLWKGNECVKTKEMIITKQLSPVKIMLVQKQQENAVAVLITRTLNYLTSSVAVV